MVRAERIFPILKFSLKMILAVGADLHTVDLWHTCIRSHPQGQRTSSESWRIVIWLQQTEIRIGITASMAYWCIWPNLALARWMANRWASLKSKSCGIQGSWKPDYKLLDGDSIPGFDDVWFWKRLAIPTEICPSLLPITQCRLCGGFNGRGSRSWFRLSQFFI